MAKIPKEVLDLCEKIEKDLTTMVKAAKDDLQKVHPGEPTSAELSPDTSATSPSPAAGGDAPPPAPPPPADASAGGPPGDAPPAPGGEETPGEGGEAAPSHEEMVQVLSSLPPEQFDAWMAAADEVKAQRDGAPGAGDGSAPPPSDGGEASPSGDDALKAETQARVTEVLAKAEAGLRTKDSEIDRLTKELTAVKGQLEKNEKDLAEAGKELQSMLRRPNRRGNVSLPPAPAGGVDPLVGLSKSEIKDRLQKACRGNVSNEQRRAVNRYLTTGEGMDDIRPLIAAAR